MESVNSRKFIKDFKVEGIKLIKILGTDEIKELEYTKGNFTRLKNDIEKQIEEYNKEDSFTKTNKTIFRIALIFLIISSILSFAYACYFASKGDFYAIILGGIICILSTTLLLVTREYNKLNNLHRNYITEASDYIKKLEKKIKNY